MVAHAHMAHITSTAPVSCLALLKNLLNGKLRAPYNSYFNFWAAAHLFGLVQVAAIDRDERVGLAGDSTKVAQADLVIVSIHLHVDSRQHSAAAQEHLCSSMDDSSTTRIFRKA